MCIGVSKLNVCIDRIVIMGSANLNDRSQMGNRDSEIAMIVEDTDIVPSKMNGEHVSRFVRGISK